MLWLEINILNWLCIFYNILSDCKRSSRQNQHLFGHRWLENRPQRRRRSSPRHRARGAVSAAVPRVLKSSKLCNRLVSSVAQVAFNSLAGVLGKRPNPSTLARPAPSSGSCQLLRTWSGCALQLPRTLLKPPGHPAKNLRYFVCPRVKQSLRYIP